jgi:hypothetical protein
MKEMQMYRDKSKVGALRIDTIRIPIPQYKKPHKNKFDRSKLKQKKAYFKISIFKTKLFRIPSLAKNSPTETFTIIIVISPCDRDINFPN